jgi:hypothetical protein
VQFDVSSSHSQVEFASGSAFPAELRSPVCKYMTHLVSHGVGAQLQLRRRGDKWGVLEEVVVTPAIASAPRHAVPSPTSSDAVSPSSEAHSSPGRLSSSPARCTSRNQSGRESTMWEGTECELVDKDDSPQQTQTQTQVMLTFALICPWRQAESVLTASRAAALADRGA